MKLFSIRWKIMIPVAIVFSVGCISLLWNAIDVYNEELKAVARSKAEAACNVAVHRVDGDAIESLSIGDEETEDYVKNRTEMFNVAKYSNLKYMYTLYKGTDGKVYYGIDSDSSGDGALIGEEFDADLELVNKAFNGEIAQTMDIDHTEDGDKLLTVYEPIYNSDGKVVAVMGCDYDAKHVLDTRYNIIIKLSIVFALTLIVDMLVVGLFTNQVIKNVIRVRNKLYDIVHNEGDLTQKVEVKTNDEVRQIADNVNELMIYMNGVLTSISNNSNELSSSVQSVVNATRDADYMVSDVTSVMEEMSAAMQETSASLNQVTNSVLAISDSIDSILVQAQESSNNSETIMSEATNIHSVAEQERQKALEEASNMIKVVNEKIEQSKAAEKINSLTDEILGITSQTNLLSLNASIEAARAGEAGKGFAVVASEIGKLAQDSSKAAEEIAKVSTEVLSAVNALAKEAQVMVDFIEEVALKGYDNLLTTSENYEDNVNNLNNVLLSFMEQCSDLSGSIKNIEEAINSVNLAVEESTKGITQVTENAVELQSNIKNITEQANNNDNVSKELNKEVAKFKLV